MTCEWLIVGSLMMNSRVKGAALSDTYHKKMSVKAVIHSITWYCLRVELEDNILGAAKLIFRPPSVSTLRG